jgi:hypothetical protein
MHLRGTVLVVRASYLLLLGASRGLIACHSGALDSAVDLLGMGVMELLMVENSWLMLAVEEVRESTGKQDDSYSSRRSIFGVSQAGFRAPLFALAPICLHSAIYPPRCHVALVYSDISISEIRWQLGNILPPSRSPSPRAIENMAASVFHRIGIESKSRP